jgi:hypothetical protein
MVYVPEVRNPVRICSHYYPSGLQVTKMITRNVSWRGRVAYMVKMEQNRYGILVEDLNETDHLGDEGSSLRIN